MLSPAILTKFSQLLDVHTPVVSAAMAGASGGALAAQVSLGGGFGFLAAAYDSAEKLRAELEIARTLLKLGPTSLLPIGVGFLGWQLEKSESFSTELLSIVLDSRVKAIWLAFGNKLEYWVNFIREHNKNVDAKSRALVFVQVCSLKEAESAIHDWKVDVLVVQGIEAGGHGASYGLPLLSLLPLVLSIIPPDGPPVLAAGGLVGGAQMASILTLGASGVVLGTRFLLSPESQYTDSQRQALLDADSTQSVRTMAFDYARNTLGWPHGIDGRGLRNATVDDYEKGEDIDMLRKKYADGVHNDDTARIVVWAGASVGLIKTIMPAKDIVLDVHQECLKYLLASIKLVSHEDTSSR